MAKTRWVNYRELKRTVSMEQVIERYGLLATFRRRGDSLVGPCPIHKGHDRRQFRISPSKNAFMCFGRCKGGGNVLDFVDRMEGGIGTREAALRLVDWFDLEGTAATQRPN